VRPPADNLHARLKKRKSKQSLLVRAKIWKKVNMRAGFDPSRFLKAEQLALLLAVPSTCYTSVASVDFHFQATMSSPSDSDNTLLMPSARS